jgi:hypothetical protein
MDGCGHKILGRVVTGITVIVMVLNLLVLSGRASGQESEPQAIRVPLKRGNVIPAINLLLDTCPDIPNGDFESGLTMWKEYSSGGYSLINNSGFPIYLTPHSGSWAVWQGGAHNETSQIQQQVTVPSNCPYLVFYHYIATEEINCSPSYDTGFTRINGTDVVDTVYLCMANNTFGWVVKSIDLSAYAGQTVLLQIGVKTDSYNHSHWYIDDVSFQAKNQ